MGLYGWILIFFVVLFLAADCFTEAVILFAAQVICEGLDRIEKAIRERS